MKYMKSLRSTINELDDIQFKDFDDMVSEIGNVKDKLIDICDDLEDVNNDVEECLKDLNKSDYIDLGSLVDDVKVVSKSLY